MKDFNSLIKIRLAPLIVFTACVIIYLFPIFKNFNYWGQMDWDQFTFWNAVPRETMLRYGQFPLWNPYVNGGNVLLAHPQSPFLSPFYILVFIFGPVLGLKLQLIVHMLIGLLGMFYFAIYIKLNRAASFMAAFVYMLSSIYALHLTEGHAEWFAMAFIPWFFLNYVRSLKEPRYLLRAVFFLVLIILPGSVDVINITNVFIFIYAIFLALQARKLIPLRLISIIFVTTFLVCSIKLLPMLEFLRDYPRPTIETDGIGFTVLFRMLLDKNQVIYDLLNDGVARIFPISYGWHEYGSYIGILPLILFFVGIIARFKQQWPLLASGFFALLIALGAKSPINLWGALHKFPIYSSLTTPSRFILGFIFCLAIFSGFGLEYLEMISKKVSARAVFATKKLVLAIPLIVFFDLFVVNSVIFNHAFIVPPIDIKRNADFRQRYEESNILNPAISRSSLYPVFLSNSGILNGYEVVNIKKGEVRTISSPGYKGEAYLLAGSGEAHIEYFSPNKVIVDVSASGPDILSLNQNYYNGWRVIKDNRSAKAGSSRGLVSTPVEAGRRKVAFYYLPRSFLVGSFITCLSLLLLLRKKIRRL